MKIIPVTGQQIEIKFVSQFNEFGYCILLFIPTSKPFVQIIKENAGVQREHK